MEYSFGIVHWAGVKHQAPDPLLRPHTKRTEDFHIKDDITIMSVPTCVQKRITKIQDNAAEQTYIQTDHPQLPTLVELMSA